MGLFSRKEPPMCGGSTDSYDKDAPKTIQSNDMVFFDVTTKMPYRGVDPEHNRMMPDPIGYFSAFAVPAFKGSFVFLETSQYGRRGEARKQDWAYVKYDIFPALTGIVKEYGVAKGNGVYHKTHGLPENFGGDAHITFASGEEINFSDNQSPILGTEVSLRFIEEFTKALREEKIALPSTDDLVQIAYREDRDRGGFSKSVLTLKEDGTGNVKSAARYDDPKIYESDKSLEKRSVAKIMDKITSNGVFGWAELPKRKYAAVHEESLTFVFKDGNEIKVPGDRALPYQIQGAFFDIELEITR
jgi:hypothetical protein